MKFVIKNGAVEIDGNTILEEINFEVNDNDHIAIVGENGAGKSTLLKAIINTDNLSEGVGEEKFTITNMGKPIIGYLEQNEVFDENTTLLDEVRKPFIDLIKMEEKIKELENILQKDTSQQNVNKYTETLDRFEILGGYTYKKEYEVLINNFGFSNEDKEKKISSFSGGERTKISFIKLLLSKPDILLLDEPTNHLDIKTISWLENYLKNYKKSIVIVSHDRMFINNICDVIYDIDYGRTSKYVGDYEYYEKEKEKRYEALLKDYEYQQKEIKRLRNIYERFRYKPTKASLAMSRLKQLEKMDIIEKPNTIDKKTFKTNIDSVERSSRNVVTVDNLSVGYDKILGKINLNIERESRIGVIGPNGSGKSTLLKTINKMITPISGEVVYGSKVKVGYFDQNLMELDYRRTILEDFCEKFKDIGMNEARSALGSFLFKGEDVFKEINVLSGGEKVRLQLCELFYKKPNFLILDEPTNHLDILGKNHLENILTDYPGTILFVSHDRYFIKKIATSLVVFDKDNISYYPYGYDEYILKQNQEIIEEKKPKAKAYKNKNKVDEELKIKKKELNSVEESITNIEERIKNLESDLCKKEVYEDYVKAKEMKDEIDELKEELIVLNERWESLAMEIL